MKFDPEEASIVIKDFIKTYLINSKCKGLVIGLSGGVDSAVTSVLCKQALGVSKVNCIFLPDNSTPEIDKKHCDLLKKKFNVNYKEKNITNLVNQVAKTCLEKPDKYALANIKARLRMIILFEYAYMKNCLVCGTSNKSELLIGYFTKYGDGGVDIMPIGDLYKTQLWELAKYLKIPKEIIAKPPSAGLWKDQYDEKEFKLTYFELDNILFGLERKFSLDDIAKSSGVQKSDIIRIKNMRIRSQHKRRSALIPKIGLRTPGNDWRSPVQLG